MSGIRSFFGWVFQAQQNVVNWQTALKIPHVLQCLDFAITVIPGEFTLPREPNTIIPGEFTQAGEQNRHVPRNSHATPDRFQEFQEFQENISRNDFLKSFLEIGSLVFEIGSPHPETQKFFLKYFFIIGV